MGLGLAVEGVPLHLATGRAWGELEWSTLADGGSGDISWSMQLPVGYAHPMLRRGRLVQVKAGAAALCAGILAEPEINTDSDGATWQFTATGIRSQGSDLYALDAAGNTSAVPDAAVDAAIANYGLRWRRSVSIQSTPVIDNAPTSGDQTDALNKVNALMDQAADQQGKRWGVDGDLNVYMAADPTIPAWYMAPGPGRFGLADDEYASTVLLRYVTTSGVYKTASATDAVAAALYGAKQDAIEGTKLGVLSDAKANALVAGALAKGKARLGWTNPVTPGKWQLTTPGGTPAPPWLVRGGQMVRTHGVIDEQGRPLPYVDWIIGEAHYAAADRALTLSPVGLVARDLTSVIAEALGVSS